MPSQVDRLAIEFGGTAGQIIRLSVARSISLSMAFLSAITTIRNKRMNVRARIKLDSLSTFSTFNGVLISTCAGGPAC